MTYEEFKEICMGEYPKIEAMVKTVKALGVKRVSCSVSADGYITFDIMEKNGRPAHASWHFKDKKAGWLQIVEYDENGQAEWKPICYYDHAIDNDKTISGGEMFKALLTHEVTSGQLFEHEEGAYEND